MSVESIGCPGYRSMNSFYAEIISPKYLCWNKPIIKMMQLYSCARCLPVHQNIIRDVYNNNINV